MLIFRFMANRYYKLLIRNSRPTCSKSFTMPSRVKRRKLNLWPNISFCNNNNKLLHVFLFSQDLPGLEVLILHGNEISRMDPNVIPTGIIRLHLGRNHIKDLNNTLWNLSNLGWLFVNSNELFDLEGQLPLEAPKLQLIHASHNSLENLPQQLKTFPQLSSLFMQNNKLRSLDGALSKSKNLLRVVLEHNEIQTVRE